MTSISTDLDSETGSDRQTYKFRLRFRLAKPLASAAFTIDLTSDQIARPISLAAQTQGVRIDSAEWLIASSKGYPFEEEARRSGNLLKDALLLSGAQCCIGIDVGQDHATTRTAQFIKDACFQETGAQYRDDVFGLDVFEDVETRVFRASGNMTVSANPDVFFDALQESAGLALCMDERSRLSAQLINDALFPLTPETRLLVLMTAIESLWPSPKRSDSIRNLTDAILPYLDTLEGAESDKEDVRTKIIAIQTNSVGTLCRQNITRLLGLNRANEFRKLYQARSRFTHDGKGRSVLQVEGDIAQHLAFDVLLAELRSRVEKL